MMWFELQSVAQTAISRILNSLPEGLLIALFSWMMLRLLPRQNSGTRFAVWFVAMLAVAGLPFIGGAAADSFSAGAARPVISMSEHWGLLLFLLWALAASAAVLRVAHGLWRLRRVRQSCTAIDVAILHPAVRKIVADFKAARSVKLATSENVSVPSAIGFFRPMIVIPAWALQEIPPEDLSIILLHEFAHLRRWDHWTNLLQKIVRAILLFHPAVWWIESHLSLEREMACDDLVLAETGNARGYAKCLIALLEKSFARRSLAMAQAAVNRGREASLRLAQILDVRRPNSKRIWKPAMGCVGAFAAICLAVVPHAPQLVAFQSSPAAVQTAAVTAIPSQSRFPSAVAIPARLYASSGSAVKLTSSAVKRTHSSVARKTWRTGNLRSDAPHGLQTLTAEAEQQSPIHAVNVSYERAVQPMETLFLVRTTRRSGPDAWTCSVYVWRIVWTDSVQTGAQKAPVAHKT